LIFYSLIKIEEKLNTSTKSEIKSPNKEVKFQDESEFEEESIDLDNIDQRDSMGRSPIFHAIENGHTKFASILLDRSYNIIWTEDPSGVDINLADNKGLYAIHIAAMTYVLFENCDFYQRKGWTIDGSIRERFKYKC
jgi:hypothetical protein